MHEQCISIQCKHFLHLMWLDHPLLQYPFRANRRCTLCISLEKLDVHRYSDQSDTKDDDHLIDADLKEFERIISTKRLPFTTCLQSENINSISPGENKKPVSI